MRGQLRALSSITHPSVCLCSVVLALRALQYLARITLARVMTEHTALTVLGVPFVKGGDALDGGDFQVMILLPQFEDALFIYNGNIEDDWLKDFPKGAGSAAIRPFADIHKDWRSAGVPTGWAAGVSFKALDDQVKQAIDLSIHHILNVIDARSYTRVLFACDPDDHDCIGMQTFNLPREVVKYVSARIIGLPNSRQYLAPRFSEAQLEWIMRHYFYQSIQRERSRPPTRPSPASVTSCHRQTTFSYAPVRQPSSGYEPAASGCKLPYSAPFALAAPPQLRQNEEPRAAKCSRHF